MTRVIRDHRALAAFFLAYYCILIAYGIAAGGGQTAFYAAFVGGGAVLIARLYARNELSALVLWGLALWGAAHMVGGLIEVGGEVVYERRLVGGEFRFDKIVHFFGFGFATLAAYELLAQNVGRDAAPKHLALTALFVGLGVGAVNETVEFLITLLPGESNVGGFSNTGWDLVANALGALVAASLAGPIQRKRASGVQSSL